MNQRILVLITVFLFTVGCGSYFSDPQLEQRVDFELEELSDQQLLQLADNLPEDGQALAGKGVHISSDRGYGGSKDTTFTFTAKSEGKPATTSLNPRSSIAELARNRPQVVRRLVNRKVRSRMTQIVNKNNLPSLPNNYQQGSADIKAMNEATDPISVLMSRNYVLIKKDDAVKAAIQYVIVSKKDGERGATFTFVAESSN